MYLVNVMTGRLTLFGQKLTQSGVKEQINLSNCVLNTKKSHVCMIKIHNVDKSIKKTCYLHSPFKY